MSLVDIIIPVCGNLPIVKECLESLYPIPKNWKLYIYNSEISDVDGTTEYLKAKQEELKFNLIDQRVSVSHGKAIETLMHQSNSVWILHLDSDVKLLDKKFYSWVESTIKSEKFKVWGRVDNREPMPNLKNSARIRLLRMQSWNVLFERKYVARNRLSFSPFKLEGSADVQKLKNKNFLIWGDTSWEYFWKASRDDLFGRYPDDIWSCFEHKGHGTVDWIKENLMKIEAMKLKGWNTICIDEMSPPTTLQLRIDKEDVLFNKVELELSTSGFYYTDINKKYFLKVVRSICVEQSLKNELVSLNILKDCPNHFPTIVDYGQNYIVMNYCGERLSASNIPKNAYKQIDEISCALKDRKVFHLDIKKAELLVKDGQIFLVDFGFSEVKLQSGRGRYPNDDFRLNYLVDNIFEEKNTKPRLKYGKEHRDGEYKKFYAKNRKELGGSQSQESILEIDGDDLTFDGYQYYKMALCEGKINFEFFGTLKNKMAELEKVKLIRDKSILDLGCSNGAAGLWYAHQYHLSEVYLYDHDSECISNLIKARNWQKEKIPSKNMTIFPKEYSFSSDTIVDRTYDYVVTLATLHWFYSATTDIGCLYSVIKKLRSMTKIALIVEWVDVTDKTVHHIKKNPMIHKSPYDRNVFLEALKINFTSYEKIGNTSETRELFVAYV